MTLKEKIDILVKYCGQHQSHGFMMDERNEDESFDVKMLEETFIEDNIAHLKVILLTGEAGDGKSRILRKIKSLLDEYGFKHICNDFSACSEEHKKELILIMKKILKGESNEKIVISANIGIFTQMILQTDIDLMAQLTSGREDVYICNFEKRNLASDETMFAAIMKQFLMYDSSINGCQECMLRNDCAYKKNIDVLLTEDGIDAMRTICNAIYLTGGHVTFREMLSLLAYSVTFGQNCDERQQLYVKQQMAGKSNDRDKIMYYNIFQDNEDILLHKVASMDPAKKRGEKLSRTEKSEIKTKADYIRYRRKNFFSKKGEKYGLLNVDYLIEFYRVLNYVNKPPYNYDSAQDKNPDLQVLKEGIKKMGNRGKSDAGLVVTDTPLIFNNQIRTEFMLMQDMSMIWHRYDVKIGQKVENSEYLWNKFNLSYVAKHDDDNGQERKKLISLLIDYKQFRYLMMCSKDYFVNRNELSVEEYAVNTFYRKILEETKQAYDAIVIRFSDEMTNVCDFSLMVHKKEDIFTGEYQTTIRIKRED